MAPILNRREFMKVSAALGAGAVTLVNCEFLDQVFTGGIVVWRRSGRGRRVSNAAKKHNANRLYLTPGDAEGDLAHPGDRSKVVPVTISNELHAELFAAGRRIADLRVHH